MSDDYGLVVAQDGRSIDELPLKFDSRTRVLTVDLEADPPHMQIVDRTAGSALTDISDPTGASHTYQETLLTVPHKFNFTPLVMPYFYVLGSRPAGNSLVSNYSADALILSGGAGTITDAITYEVDKTELRIVHRLDTYGSNSGYVSPAPSLDIRIKFYITPIDTGIDLFRYLGNPY